MHGAGVQRADQEGRNWSSPPLLLGHVQEAGQPCRVNLITTVVECHETTSELSLNTNQPRRLDLVIGTAAARAELMEVWPARPGVKVPAAEARKVVRHLASRADEAAQDAVLSEFVALGLLVCTINFTTMGFEYERPAPRPALVETGT